jgi:hypothetical protein
MGGRGGNPAHLIGGIIRQAREQAKRCRTGFGDEQPSRPQSFPILATEVPGKPLRPDGPGNALERRALGAQRWGIQVCHRREEEPQLSLGYAPIRFQKTLECVQCLRLRHGPTTLAHQGDQQGESGRSAALRQANRGRPDPVPGILEGSLDDSQGKPRARLRQRLSGHPPGLRVGIGHQEPSCRVRVDLLQAEEEASHHLPAFVGRVAEELDFDGHVSVGGGHGRGGHGLREGAEGCPFLGLGEDIQCGIEQRIAGRSDGVVGRVATPLLIAPHGRTFVVRRRRRRSPGLNPA